MIIIRLLGNCKARIVKLVDQQPDFERIKQGVTSAIIAGKDLAKESSKKEFLKMYALQQLHLFKKVSIAEPFILPTLDQMMDNEQSILSFILKQQNQSMTSQNPLLFDFKAPLEFELILVKDSQT